MQEQFNMFEQNFHILCDCNQMLFLNQQQIFNFDPVSSLLAMRHAGKNSYRADLFAYDMNFPDFIHVLLLGHLPMSLIPMDSPLVIFESVAIQQSMAGDRLSLAISMTDLLAYYDSS